MTVVDCRVSLIYLFVHLPSHLFFNLSSRESLPLVSTREPPNYDIIGAGSLEGEAAVHIRAEYRSRFRVYFVAAFFHEHYVYYLSVQNKYLSNGKLPFIVSKLIRICRDEHRLNLKILKNMNFFLEKFRLK